MSTARTIYKTLGFKKKQHQPCIARPDFAQLIKYFYSLDQHVNYKRSCDGLRLSCEDFEKDEKYSRCGDNGIGNEILKCCSSVVEESLVLRFIKALQIELFPITSKLLK